MAARKDGLHSERVRQRIRVSQLTRRLQDNALGTITMTPTQVESAKFLINKVMSNPPERKELSGPYGGPIQQEVVEIVSRGVLPPDAV